MVVRRQVVKFFADEPLRQQLDAPQALAALASLAIIVASSTGLQCDPCTARRHDASASADSPGPVVRHRQSPEASIVAAEKVDPSAAGTGHRWQSAGA